MKIRKGFVSNSSSSSFIIGISTVSDIDKYNKYIKDNNIGEEVKVITFKDVKENRPWQIEPIRDNKLTVESFDCSSVTLDIKNIKDDDYILMYVFFGSEGDDSFMDEDSEWSELDYDIDYDFFSKEQKDVLDMFSNPKNAGLNEDNTLYTLGAARNG